MRRAAGAPARGERSWDRQNATPASRPSTARPFGSIAPRAPPPLSSPQPSLPRRVAPALARAPLTLDDRKGHDHDPDDLEASHESRVPGTPATAGGEVCLFLR